MYAKVFRQTLIYWKNGVSVSYIKVDFHLSYFTLSQYLAFSKQRGWSLPQTNNDDTSETPLIFFGLVISVVRFFLFTKGCVVTNKLIFGIVHLNKYKPASYDAQHMVIWLMHEFTNSFQNKWWYYIVYKL